MSQISSIEERGTSNLPKGRDQDIQQRKGNGTLLTLSLKGLKGTPAAEPSVKDLDLSR
jgi:hypothetical protein